VNKFADWDQELKTAPSIEPVTATEAKLHCKINTSDDDNEVTILIQAARKYAETYTGRQIITAHWYFKGSAFPSGDIVLPKSPLQTVTSVKYNDLNGDQQTFSSGSYTVVTPNHDLGRIVLNYGEDWPTARSETHSIIVEYKAGYGDATTDVPENMRAAILMMILGMYDYRGPVTDVRVQELPAMHDLLATERILSIV
jgi:uncharacterized phiE125 gp8 family phage protein